MEENYQKFGYKNYRVSCAFFMIEVFQHPFFFQEKYRENQWMPLLFYE